MKPSQAFAAWCDGLRVQIENQGHWYDVACFLSDYGGFRVAFNGEYTAKRRLASSATFRIATTPIDSPNSESSNGRHVSTDRQETGEATQPQEGSPALSGGSDGSDGSASGGAQTGEVCRNSLKAAPCPRCGCLLAVATKPGRCPQCHHVLDPAAPAPEFSIEEKFAAVSAVVEGLREERFALLDEINLLRKAIVTAHASIRQNVKVGSSAPHMKEYNEGALWADGILSQRERDFLGAEVMP